MANANATTHIDLIGRDFTGPAFSSAARKAAALQASFAGLQRASAGIGRVQSGIQRASDSLLQKGTVATAAFTLPVMAAFKSILDKTRQLEKARGEAARINLNADPFDGDARAPIDVIIDRNRALARQLGVTRTEALETTTEIQKLGYSYRDAAAYAAAAQRFSVISDQPVGKASSQLSQFVNLSSIMPTNNIKNAADRERAIRERSGLATKRIMAAADVSSLDPANIPEIGKSIMPILRQQAQAMGKTTEEQQRLLDQMIDERLIMAGILKDAGFQDGEIGRSMKTTELRALAPTKQAIAAMDARGMDVSKFTTYQNGGIDRGALENSIKSRLNLKGLNVRPLIDRELDSGIPVNQAVNNIVTDLGKRYKLKGQDLKVLRKDLSDALASQATGVDMMAMFREAKRTGVTPGELAKLTGKEHASKAGALQTYNGYDERAAAYRASLAQADLVDKGYAVKLQTLDANLIMVGKSWTRLQEAIGSSKSGAMSAFSAGLTRLITGAEKFADTNPEAVTQIAGLGLAAAAAGPGLALLGGALALLSGPRLAFAAGVYAITNALNAMYKPGQLVSGIMSKLGLAAERAGDAFKALVAGNFAEAGRKLGLSFDWIGRIKDDIMGVPWGAVWDRMSPGGRFAAMAAGAYAAIKALKLLRVAAAGAMAGAAAVGGVVRRIAAGPGRTDATASRMVGNMGALTAAAASASGSVTRAGIASRIAGAGMAAGAVGARLLGGALRLLTFGLGPIFLLFSGISGLVKAWDELKGKFGTGFGDIWSGMKDGIGAVVALITGDLAGAWDRASDAAKNVWSGVSTVAVAALQAIVVGASELFGADGSKVWGGVQAGAASAWAAAKEAVAGLADKVASVAETIKAAWSTVDIAGPFRAAAGWVDGLIAKIGALVDAAKSLAGIGGGAPKVPDIQTPQGLNTAPALRQGESERINPDGSEDYSPAGPLPPRAQTFEDRGIMGRLGSNAAQTVRMEGPVPVEVQGEASVRIDVQYNGPLTGDKDKSASIKLDTGRSTVG